MPADHQLRPGGAGSPPDDFRVWLTEDDNGNGPGECKTHQMIRKS